jgi:hypothetical protein
MLGKLGDEEGALVGKLTVYSRTGSDSEFDRVFAELSRRYPDNKAVRDVELWLPRNEVIR